METVKGARGLFLVRAVTLGWSVVSTVMWALPLGERSELWYRANAVLWLAFAVAELIAVVPFSQGRAGTTAETPARSLIVLLALGFPLSLALDLPQLGGPHLLEYGPAIALVQEALFVAGEICLWMALT